MINKTSAEAFNTAIADSAPILKATSGISNDTIKALKAVAGIEHKAINIFYADRKLTNLSNLLLKVDGYLKIVQIPNVYIPKITSPIEKINSAQDEINQLFSDMDEICSILSEYNYLLPLTLSCFIYSDLLKYIKNANKSNDEKEIDKILLKLFSDKNWEMASKIANKLHDNSKINPKRIIILKDCIKVLKHNSRKTAANTILPVLIAQIDGIWVDILGSKDKDKLKNIIENMKMDKYTNPARELLSDILFQYTKTSVPVKSVFCRNKILHGEEVEYGSINNVIRAFLIIEFLDFIKTGGEVEKM